MSVSRRQLLIALATVAPSARFLSPSFALAKDMKPGAFLKVSQLITGNRHLDPAVSRRIENALKNRLTRFSDRLKTLAERLSRPGDRDSLLGNLTPEETDFAFEIAQPWYLGFIGTPKGNMLNDDDAEFVTYLQAQSYELVHDELPRPGYPPDARGWWVTPPSGVNSPPMADSIKRWDIQQPGAHGHIIPADEQWKAYALGQTDIKPS